MRVKSGAPFGWTCLAALAVTMSAARAVTIPVIDINKTAPPPISSNPVVLGDLDGKILFAATDATSRGLWSTDGTAAGTELLKRFAGSGGIFGSANQLSALTVGGAMYFAADDGITGLELWKTDGTAAGTEEVADLAPGPASSQPILVGVFGGRLVFEAQDGASISQLYITDGTTAGTLNLTNYTTAGAGAGTQLISVGSKFYFAGAASQAQQYVYVSDGTPAGTRPLNNPYGIAAVNFVSSFSLAGSLVLYEADSSLWSIDPTTDSIGAVAAAGGAGSGPPIITPLVGMSGGYVLFMVDLPGNALQLWRSDGTAAGTHTVAPPGFNLSLPNPFFFESVGTRVLFPGYDSTNGFQVWSSDGTAANTVRLTSAPQPGQAPAAIYPGVVNGVAYFALPGGSASGTVSIWRSNGTSAGTFEINGIAPVGSDQQTRVAGDSSRVYIMTDASGAQGAVVSSLYVYDGVGSSATLLEDDLDINQTDSFFADSGRLFFSNVDPLTGEELWVSDGTSAGTAIIEDLNPEAKDASSNPDEFVNFNGKLAFAADDGVSGTELWTSDGTTAGTRLLADINPGAASSNPNHLFVSNGNLFLFATDASGSSKLMLLPSGAAAPQALANLSAPSELLIDPLPDTFYCSDNGFVSLAGKVYLPGVDSSGLRLWGSDGTTAGTAPVTAAGMSQVCNLTVLGNKIYFSGATSTSSVGLWVSDGTAAGTAQVTGATPWNPTHLMAYNGLLYFAAEDSTHGIGLWKSDGTAAGTSFVTTLAPPGPGNTRSAAGPVGILNGKLLFSGLLYGQPLWAIDGTSAAPVLLDGDVTGTVTINGDSGYFASDASGALQPWVTDGTAAGTHMLKDIQPTSTSTLAWFASFNSVVLFEVVDPNAGDELWRTDGTEQGTLIAGQTGDPPALVNSVNPTAVQRLAVGRYFFFSAKDPEFGQEPSVVSFDALPPVTNGGEGSGGLGVLDILGLLGLVALGSVRGRTGRPLLSPQGRSSSVPHCLGAHGRSPRPAPEV